ncbi:class I adenylate-forming enzyme family protein [Rhodoligotrophos ferricapiens]|uniref:class I adenylate-forming enzyme family protein n=1 Tax=Rhodoligotrophos ferricapiens TaxID=3069264 RepID=UPI00315CE4CF
MSILHRYSRRDFETHYAAGHWTKDHLLDTIAGYAAEDPDFPAVIDGAYRVSRKELLELVDRAVSSFRSEGIGPGDIVAVQLPNSLHIVVAALALLRIGAVFHTLNPSYRFADVAKIFGRSRPKFYVYTRVFRGFEYQPLVDALGNEGGFAFRSRLLDIDLPLDAQLASKAAPASDLPPPDRDAIYLLGTTSGSTGDPKLYMHTQNTQFNEARTLNREMGIDHRDVFLAFAPMTHRGVFMWGFMQALAAGAPLVLERLYDPKVLMRTIDRERVTSLFAIPTQVVDMLDACRNGHGAGHSLRVVMMAGAPVQPELVARIKQVWPHCAPVTGFGTSETGYAVITRPSYSLERLQTCGCPLDGMEVRVDQVAGGDDPTGELLLRGAFLSAGYYDDQQATYAAYDKDGWFRTGDLGHLDAEGNVIVTGRIKNVIIRSGLKIQAEEIEHILLRHPAVAQAIIVGIPDAQVGERAVACVVAKDRSGELRLEDITAFLETHGIAKFKWPEQLAVLDELPMNAVGKFDRIGMRKQLVGMRAP